MKRLFTFFALLAGLAASPAASGPATYDITDTTHGIYEGTWKNDQGAGKFTAQLRQAGNGAYDGFMILNKGAEVYSLVKLASAPSTNKSAVALTTSPLSSPQHTNAVPVTFTAEIRNGKLTGNFGDSKTAKLAGKKVKKKSPTLGAKPPKGAKVVFDGRDHGVFREQTWDIVEGALQVTSQKGELVAKEQFSDFELHVEFRTPLMEAARGQGRGNSGVYLQSIYEVQVLDSFGLFPLQINDCGSIYAIQAAPGNASLPPGQWQTYDIIFRNGGPGQVPEITVRHNGVLTIDRAKVPEKIVGKGGGSGTPGGGFLKLQDHGNPVQYRNIWVVPLK